MFMYYNYYNIGFCLFLDVWDEYIRIGNDWVYYDVLWNFLVGYVVNYWKIVEEIKISCVCFER